MNHTEKMETNIAIVLDALDFLTEELGVRWHRQMEVVGITCIDKTDVHNTIEVLVAYGEVEVFRTNGATYYALAPGLTNASYFSGLE